MGPFLGGVLKFGAALIFGAGAGASAVYALAVNVARLAILSYASKALAPNLDLTQVAQDKLVTIRSTVAPQAFTYGRDMLSGPVIFANNEGVSPDSLHRLVALHGREIDGFNAFRIDDNDIVIPTDIPDDSDTVSGGLYAGVVDIDTRTGATDQTAISALTSTFPSLWTSAHRARGWSLLFTKMTPEGNNEAFETGIPQNLRADVDGHLVYDPRLDSTQTGIGGSGAHRVDDPSTWEWSDNPALCWADHKIWVQVGYGEAPARVNWASVATAADICDESVDVPGGTQKRYTCNFTFYADMERAQVKDIIVQSMIGREVFSQGQWHVWAGAQLTPDVTLSEANLAGGIQVQASAGYKERFNRVHGTFIDPTRDYTANPYPEQRDSTYETADGSAIYRKLDLPACNNSFEAQRAAIITLRKSRNQRVVVFEGNWSCFRILPGSVVALDCAELGWTGEVFFVTEWSLRKDQSGVTLAMVQEQNVWADPDTGDYTTRTPTGELIPPSAPDVALSDATIHNSLVEATCHAGIRLTSDGFLEYKTAGGGWTRAGVPLGQWRRRGLAEWWVRFTENSGTLDTGTADTWQALSTTREASIEQISEGVNAANVTAEISSTSDGSNVQASAVFDLEAEYVVPALVALSGGTVFHSHPDDDGVNASCTLAFFRDGRCMGGHSVSPSIVNAGEWWADEPDASNPGDNYDVRCASISEGTFQSEAAAVGTWTTMTEARNWNVVRAWSSNPPGTTQVIATWEIRATGDGDNVIASAEYTLQAILT
jgi:hypothetical protein